MHQQLAILVITLAVYISTVSSASPIIATAQGIPFGKIPARFHNSVPAESWKGVRDGTKFGSGCSQSDAFFLGKQLGTEDCLFINIFTPKLFDGDTTKLLPVMVFIYGGGFNFGNAADYAGNYFTDQDVVFVTLNYRVGPFGFLNAGIKGASGNQGLKDLVLGLKWVRDNIEQFGGDSNRTTIVGQSAGGAAVNLLTLSPMAKGLFTGAIAMSGAATCPWANKNEPSLKNVQKLAAAVDCPTSNSEYMVECLRRIDAKYILEATKYPSLYGWNWEEVPQFGPTIENPDVCDDETENFLTEDPFKIAVEGRFNKVPYVSGLVKHEGHLIWASHIINNENATKKMNEEWSKLAPSSFYYQQSSLDTCKVSSEIKNFYFKEKPIGKETSTEMTNLYSDRMFNQCVKEMAIALGKHTDVYLYQFDKNVTNSISDLLKIRFYANETEQPPLHADELQFLTHVGIFYPEIKSGDKYANFSDSFSKLWASFAKQGKPSDLWGSATEWSRIEPNSKTPKWYTINDDTKFEVQNKEFTERMDFWENLPLNEYGRVFKEKKPEKLPIKKIKGTNLYTGVYYQIGMKSFPKGWVTLSNQTEDQKVRYPIIDNKMDTSRSVNSQWMFEETENEGWYTLNNRGMPNGLATWSSTKRGSGFHLSMTMSEYQAISGDKGNVLWRPEPSNQENFYSIKMKDFPLGIVTWTYDKYDNDSHYLIVATKTEDMVNYHPGEKWYNDKLFNFHSPRLW